MNKTLRLIKEIWSIGDPEELKDRLHPELTESDLIILREKITACLVGRGGEVSARSRAAELGRGYLILNNKGKRRFLELLATEFDIDHDAINTTLVRHQQVEDPAELQKVIQELRNLLEPPRTKLLRQFNELQEGVKFLVDLRADLIPWAKTEPALQSLDQDVYRLLVSWFDIGFLDLRRITWNTSAAILEKMIEYEAVHAISSLKDLKNRLLEDRRCYAFFHPRMLDEPLIFVEVALVNGMSDNVLELLDVEAPIGDPQKADTAIFYSISNCQAGLAGVSFGNFLIKRVVADLANNHPNLKTFSTLSPIPGLLKWATSAADPIELSEQETSALAIATAQKDGQTVLQDIIQSPRKHPEIDIKKDLEDVLKRLCARYLLEAKRGQQAYDRVAHFHLCNGAQIERINWAGDLSSAGVRQSAGIMVNYLYDLARIEKNHELYTGRGEITASPAVRRLLKK
ncbi:MAG: malonyl-CoA decarboxylase [Deltaproteobacteria bacterium]|nr:malonyl-CoA decarboxylase [Deltaproteobacteria bacterium]